MLPLTKNKKKSAFLQKILHFGDAMYGDLNKKPGGA